MKKNLTIIIIFIIFAALIAGFLIYKNSNTKTENVNSNIKLINNSQVNTQLDSSINPGTVGSSELAKHNSASDCWIVYMHPGGANTITPYCGANNFESSFLGKHPGSKYDQQLKDYASLKGVFG